MQRSFPDVPRAVYVSVGDAGARQVFVDRWWSMTGILFAGIDDHAAGVRPALAAVRSAHIWRVVSKLLPAGLPSWVRDAMRYSIGRASDPMSVGALNRARTMNDRCERIGLGNTENLVLWGRVFVAAYELRYGGKPFAQIARDMQYRQPRSLRAVVRDRLGCTATGLGDRDALAVAVARFTSAVAGAGHVGRP
jgi:hypothetical protein